MGSRGSSSSSGRKASSGHSSSRSGSITTVSSRGKKQTVKANSDGTFGSQHLSSGEYTKRAKMLGYTVQ